MTLVQGQNRTKCRRWLLAVFAGVILIAFFMLPPTLNALARQLMRSDPVTSADVIIALGGDARCHREKRAAELYLEGKGQRVIVSGVLSAWGVHTGDAAKRYVVSLGVPEDRVIVLRESWNTRREAIDVAVLMKDNGWKSGILVTSPFHSRRAHYTFERYAPGYSFYSSPLAAEAPEWRPDRWWSRRGDMGFTVREAIAWVNTLAGGLQ